MVQFEVVPGRKGPDDQLVKVWAYGEVLSFREILFLLDKYFRSEEGYYPKPRFEGSCMLMKAVLEVYSEIPLEMVLKKYGLDRKRDTIITERLNIPRRTVTSKTNLGELLE
jgi:hypothetical protein